MSVVQLLVIAVICLVATAPDGLVLPDQGRDWAAIIYMALVAGALGLLAQTWAQSQLSPTRTAIIMSMEPVFAAFFAVLLGGEDLDARGCCSAARWCWPRCWWSSSGRGASSRARSSTSPSDLVRRLRVTWVPAPRTPRSAPAPAAPSKHQRPAPARRVTIASHLSAL